MSALKNWLYKFIENKGLDLNHLFEIELKDRKNVITLATVVEQILSEKPTTQIAIQTKLLMLDLKSDPKNEPLLKYFEFLAMGMCREIVITSITPEVQQAIELLEANGFIIRHRE